MNRIGFGPRFGAALIDVVILIVVVIIIAAVFGVGGAASGAFSGDAAASGASYGGSVAMALVGLAYWSLEIFKAATPGKMVLKLVIRNEDGSPAPQAVLVTRWAIKQSCGILTALAAITTIEAINLVGFLAGLIIFVGCFFVLSEAKQALHDKIAKTAVFTAGA